MSSQGRVHKLSWFSGIPFAAAALLAVSAGSAQGAGILVQSFASHAEFEASPLHAFLMALQDGVPANSATGVAAIYQGSTMVPASSAGVIGNDQVTAEIELAALSVPNLCLGAADSAACHKMFVSVGHEASGLGPSLNLILPPVLTDSLGGFLGYDIAVFDVGKDLVSDTGRKNSERTSFQVGLQSEGLFYTVGTNTNSGGDFINVILLDVTGIPGLPSTVDAIRIIDATGSIVPVEECLDVDGVVRLNDGPTTPVRVTSWGALKASRR